MIDARRIRAGRAGRQRFTEFVHGLPADRGQATVELVALVPVLVAVALAVAVFLAGRSAREAADQAAVAGAVAGLQGGDPKQAAAEASPAWSRPRIRVANGRITVVVTPRVPRAMARVIGASRTVVFDEAAAR